MPISSKRCKALHKEMFDTVVERWPKLTFLPFSKQGITRIASPVTYTCPDHGTRQSRLDSIFNSKHGCGGCGNKYKNVKAKKVVPITAEDKYDFSSLESVVRSSSVPPGRTSQIRTESDYDSLESVIRPLSILPIPYKSITNEKENKFQLSGYINGAIRNPIIPRWVPEYLQLEAILKEANDGYQTTSS